jgi:hypothetical protein
VDADKLIAEYAHANEARRQTLIFELSVIAMNAEGRGKGASVLPIRSFLANLDLPSAPSLNDADIMRLVAAYPPAPLGKAEPASPELTAAQQRGLEEMALFIDPSAPVINLSRELCEAAGIPCPPSPVRAHELAVHSRPANERIPDDITALVRSLGFNAMQAANLRPYAHAENIWREVLWSATHGDDPDAFATLNVYVRERSLCSASDLDRIPADRAEWLARRAAKQGSEELLATFLASNDPHAEDALRGLIRDMRKIGATTVTLTDHPGYGFTLGIAEHNGRGKLPKSIALAPGFDDWIESLDEDVADEVPDCNWPWIRARWLACGGPASGMSVTLFFNGAGDTMDLTTGAT